MKHLFQILTLALTSCTYASQNTKPEPLNIGEMIQPIGAHAFYTEPGYSTWDGNLFKEGDTYYLIYSRWKSQGGDWLVTSEICIAESKSLKGPFKHKQVLLKGRGKPHWDELNAHNPKLKKFKDKYYLYYISSRSGETRSHIRDSQRIGVAISNSLFGPYKRLNQPIVTPEKPVHNIVVNPGIALGPKNRFVMILKGDKAPKKPTDSMGQRVQGIALSRNPAGPFKIQPKLAVSGIDTEDASIWYDKARRCFFAIYHAHHYVGLITSKDGINWENAPHSKIMHKQIMTTTGEVKKLNCIERPFVFFENGKPAALCLSVRRGSNYNTGACLIIPLSEASQP